jgi:hypothetical protein
MTEVVRGRRLAPAGCQLFSFREMDKLQRALETRLAAERLAAARR